MATKDDIERLDKKIQVLDKKIQVLDKKIQVLDKKIQVLDKKTNSNHKELTDKIGYLSEMHTAGALKKMLSKSKFKNYELLPNVLLYKGTKNIGQIDYVLIYPNKKKWNIVFIEVKTSFSYKYLSDFVHKFKKNVYDKLRFSVSGKKHDTKTLLELIKSALDNATIKEEDIQISFWFIFYLPARLNKERKKTKELMKQNDISLYEIVEKGKELRKIEL